jgi:hypothetical protein
MFGNWDWSCPSHFARRPVRPTHFPGCACEAIGRTFPTPSVATEWDAGRAAWQSWGVIVNRARGDGSTAGRARHARKSSTGTGRAGANHSVVTGTGHGQCLARNNAGGSCHQRILGIDLGRVRKGTRGALTVCRGNGRVTFRCTG